MGVTVVRVVYTVGVLLVAAGLFCSPVWWAGLVVVGCGAVWAAYDLIDVEGR